MIDPKLLTYKAKRISDGSWQYGNYIQLDNPKSCDHIIIEPWWNGGQFIVDGNTVCIGSKLKDTRGVEIYTDDIVSFVDPFEKEKIVTGVVKFGGSLMDKDNCLRRFTIWKDENTEFYDDHQWYDLDIVIASGTELRVIGNAHDKGV